MSHLSTSASSVQSDLGFDTFHLAPEPCHSPDGPPSAAGQQWWAEQNLDWHDLDGDGPDLTDYDDSTDYAEQLEAERALWWARVADAEDVIAQRIREFERAREAAMDEVARWGGHPG